jgi:hypothetical protein
MPRKRHTIQTDETNSNPPCRMFGLTPGNCTLYRNVPFTFLHFILVFSRNFRLGTTATITISQSQSILERESEKWCGGSVFKSHAMIPWTAYKWFQRKYCWNDKSTREATRCGCSCHSLLNPDTRFTGLTNRQGLTFVVCVSTSSAVAACAAWLQTPITYTHSLTHSLTHSSIHPSILRTNTRVNWLKVQNRMCAMWRN